VNIKMIGIDHNKASVEYREQFALTKNSSIQAMNAIREIEGVNGCIIISTCNRTEVWISHDDCFQKNLGEYLCERKRLEYDTYQKYFTERTGEEAARHLFRLACGIKSSIFGEDQIITQVKDSLSLARDNYCTDNVLEVLFRMAVTAAKRVKTEVRLTNASHSVVEEAISFLHRKQVELKDKTCMVIGNGEMGKLSALALKNQGAHVTVTVRQYKSGVVNIPGGCSRINYSERMEFIKDCDVVISATSSPNCTIKYEELKTLTLKDSLILVDLAVPRDIEARVSKRKGITLYDIDDFKQEVIDERREADLEKVEGILSNQMEEFITWYECQDLIPVVKQIANLAAKDIGNRVWGVSSKLNMKVDCKESLEKTIDEAARKVVDKLIFGLRDNVGIDTWRECIESMNKIYFE
jgi:glutamyl-tRNA reductase